MLRVRVVWSGVPGTPWYTNHYFAGTSESAAAAAVVVVGDCYSTISDVVGIGISMQIQGEVFNIDPASGEILGSFDVGPVGVINGSAAGDLLPIGTCARIKYTTGVYQDGRQVQGSTFIGGMVEPNSSSTGTLNSGLRGELINAFDAMTLGTPILDIWSRPRKARGGDNPLPAREGAAYPAKGVDVSSSWTFLRSHRD